MTPEQRFIAKWVAIGLFLSGMFAAGYGVRDYMAGKDKLAMELEAQKSVASGLTEYIAKTEARDAEFHILRAKLTAHESASARKLNEQLTENARLRDQLVAAGSMRLKGTVCPKQPTGAPAGSPVSSGDGEGVELSEATGRSVFDLRESILRDQADLDYLKGYLRRLGLYPQEKAPE